MTNNKTHFQMDALFTVAEDIERFAPWGSAYAPFVLKDAEHPEAAVLVVMDAGEGKERDIRLILGKNGIRAWISEQFAADAEDTFMSAEEFVARYEGYFLEVGYNMPNLNSYEKHELEGRDSVITFRRQRPGYGMATIVDGRDFAHIERYLRAILKLLTKRMLDETTDALYRLRDGGTRELLQAAAFTITPDEIVPDAPFVLTSDDWSAIDPPAVDEFTDARVKHLPADGRMYELFYFYLPMMESEKGELPRAFFLVDLETGFIEWNEVQTTDKAGREAFLRALWQHFLEIGNRPSHVLIKSVLGYSAFAADFKRAGITLEHIIHSYVGQELLETYLQAAHLRAHEVMDDPFPRNPY